MNPLLGIFILLFAFTVYFALAWHFRQKVPGLYDAGGYGSVYVYGAPLFAVIGLGGVLLFSVDCFLGVSKSVRHSGIHASLFVLFFVGAVTATLIYHRTRSVPAPDRAHRWFESGKTSWLLVSLLSAAGVLLTGGMCLLQRGS
jgi:uncharacterized membrane protein YoaK (UPF0700 family)